MSDEAKYFIHLEEKRRHWESLCGHCGACCGASDGDPCENLATKDDGRYYCRIYEQRFGLRRTKSGRVFRCVPIRNILHQSWPGDECCGYKKHLKRVDKGIDGHQ